MFVQGRDTAKEKRLHYKVWEAFVDYWNKYDIC